MIVHKLMGCLCGNYALKCMLDMENAGNGPFDRSQNMGPNGGNFFWTFGTIREAQKLMWTVMLEFMH